MPTIRRRGFDAAPISDRIEAITHDDWRAGNPRAALARAVRIFTERADHDAPDLARAIDQERPDALLVDVNAWGALAAAEAWAGPWAMFCPYPLAVRSRDVPPFGPGLPPARGPLGRLRDQLLRPIVFGTLERTMAPPINRIRDRLGLAPVGGADDIFGRAPLLLYLTAEPFEYPRSDWPDNVVLVGPCAWDPPTTHQHGWTTSTGRSCWSPPPRSSRTTPAWSGWRWRHWLRSPWPCWPRCRPATPRAFGRRPTRAWSGSSPPPGAGPRACAVTHGGMGATQKALAHGGPVCAVPFGRDQLEVARRVEVAGAGTRLPAKRLRADRLRAKVGEAMRLRDGAERVQEAFAAAGGPSAAADAFEHRLLHRELPQKLPS